MGVYQGVTTVELDVSTITLVQPLVAHVFLEPRR